MKNIYELISRYLVIFLAGLGNLYIFYALFTPLTLQLSYGLFSILGDANLFGNLILYNGLAIELIEACIAGSAYYLLFILTFSTANIKFMNRLAILAAVLVSFLVFNVLRIVFMGLIFGQKYFSQIHLFFWYFVSIILVIVIWFSTVKLFKVKSIPIYSDILSLIKIIKTTK